MASEGTNNEEKVDELDIPEGTLGTSGMLHPLTIILGSIFPKMSEYCKSV